MKHLVLALGLVAALAAPGAARTIEERLVAGLRDQGYVIVEEGYTFLGRLRIVAQNDRFRREIVVNPGTGEVLRDYAVELGAPKAGTLPSGNTSSAPSGGVAAASGGPADAVPSVTDKTVSTGSAGLGGTGTSAAVTGGVTSAGTPTPGTSASDGQPDLILSEPALSTGQGVP